MMNSITTIKCLDLCHNLDVVAICLNKDCTQRYRLCCSKCLIKQHNICSNQNFILFTEDLKQENYSEILKIAPFNGMMDSGKAIELKESSTARDNDELSKAETNLNDKIQRLLGRIESKLQIKKEECLENLQKIVHKDLFLIKRILKLKEYTNGDIKYSDFELVDNSCNEVIKEIMENDKFLTISRNINLVKIAQKTESHLISLEEKIINLIDDEMKNDLLMITNSSIKFNQSMCSKHLQLNINSQKISKKSNSGTTNDAGFTDILNGSVKFSVKCSGIKKPNGDWIQFGLIADEKNSKFESFSSEYTNTTNYSISSGNYFNGKNHHYGLTHERGTVIDFCKEIIDITYNELESTFTVENEKIKYSSKVKKDVKYRFFAMLYEIGNELELIV